MVVIAQEFRKSFDFQSRTNRQAYLPFLAVCIGIFVLTLYLLYALVPEDWFAVSALCATAISYIPVTSAGVRRLHDAGFSGTLMLDPLKPVFVVLLAYLVFIFVGKFFLVVHGVLLFSAFFFAPIVALLLIGIVIVASLFSLGKFSHVSGLLLLPSQSDSNKYGPNPNEVPS